MRRHRETWLKLPRGEELTEAEFAKVLGAFSRQQREAIQLCLIQGKTHKAAAEALGLKSRSSVTKRIATVESEIQELVACILRERPGIH